MNYNCKNIEEARALSEKNSIATNTEAFVAAVATVNSHIQDACRIGFKECTVSYDDLYFPENDAQNAFAKKLFDAVEDAFEEGGYKVDYAYVNGADCIKLCW